MSPRLPRVTAAELLRALRRDGWVEARQSGSYVQLTHPAKPGRVTVPRHTGKTIHPTILQSILQQAGLSADELPKLV